MSVLPHTWPWKERPTSELPPQFTRYLADTETKVLGGQVHEASMLEPVISAVGAFVAMVVIGRLASEKYPFITYALITLFLALVVRLAWRSFEWTRTLIFITGYRIIYTHGIVTRRVAMLPIQKVTDMSYNRTPNGMLFHYGEFVIESAGQDQALRTINFVPDPDNTYRYVQNLLFKKVPQDVSVVDVKTKKRLPVSWGGRLRQDPGAPGGLISQEEDPTDGW